ncbi:hypothetical protein ACIPSE_37400 [Streptomyces sp. NPDC090106]|uniref:hypothetical protein n=1 Tax=Streptomyces sp. NPDC090106 TaxID=3365946 RepID=UPI0037FB1045
MHSRGHMLRLTAVSVLVVLALTGFKGRGHGSSHGDGGGCSSSSQNHDSSSSTTGGGSTYHDYDDDDDDYAGSSSSSGGSSSSSPSGHEDGTARLISCATVKDPYATVEVTNPNAAGSTFDVHIVFLDADGLTVDGTIEQITVPGDGERTVRIEVANAEESAAEVDHCDLDPVASYDGDDVTGW